VKFDDQVITEITAPNNVPFQPGFNIIGIGTEIPAEMQALGFTAAIIFYTSNWDTSATTPRVKYFFLGTQSGFMISGIGWSANPSTTPTATVDFTNLTGLNTVGSTAFLDVIWASLSNPFRSVFRVTESALGASILIQDAAGIPVWQQQGSVRGQNWFISDPILNEIQLFWSSDLQLMAFGATNNLGYGQWINVTYQNGWFATVAPTFGRSGIGLLRLPDGTVQMTGVAEGGTLAVGTVIANIAQADYRPRFSKRIIIQNPNASGQITVAISGVSGNITIVGAFAAALGETCFESSWTTQG
jgi:hypothetical protein